MQAGDESMTQKRCVIIGASPETDIELLKENIRTDDYVVCADGGMLFAQNAGLIPDLIIGDFDSSAYPDDSSCEVIRLPVSKDDTDTIYCIKECLKRGFTVFLLSGMTGGRQDHTFANYCALLYLAKRGASAKIIDREGSCEVLSDSSAFIVDKKDCGFAVFPFGCEKCMVTLRGFLYEIENAELTADFPIGVSNKIVSDRAFVQIDHGSALIMVYNKQ